MNVSKESLSDGEMPKYKSVACQTDITGRKPRASLATVLRLEKLRYMRRNWNVGRTFFDWKSTENSKKKLRSLNASALSIRSSIENLQETAFLNVPDDRLDELPDDEQKR
ncbi:hypothetical protein L5515_014723 [Caenorhabditis briggsae]|uniref:Uncharacterized protein n=1 Tax=Caenorhabditis briggsae TaxID=6238 RepID=A0AAE9EE66_CAEBR|nr:hypothetical protein L5515_014723 [Caenorhabditis briggsae]